MTCFYTCAQYFYDTYILNFLILGKLYAELGRRGGRVVGSDLQTGSASFRVQALLPVAESFKFALELRTHTSGLAAPQMLFSHWEVTYFYFCTRFVHTYIDVKYFTHFLRNSTDKNAVNFLSAEC